jgi:hypothetical protein
VSGQAEERSALVPSTSHGQGCSCQRCVGFERGNTAAVKSGARAKLMLVPRAEALADALREVVPVGAPADEPAISMYGMAAAQAEAAGIWLATMQAKDRRGELSAEERETMRRLGQDTRSWINTVMKTLDALGCTPTSRARLGLDIAATRRQLTFVEMHRLAALEAAERDDAA